LHLNVLVAIILPVRCLALGERWCWIQKLCLVCMTCDDCDFVGVVDCDVSIDED